MSKYEIKVKLAQIQRFVEEKKYKKAAAVLGTLDVAQIRSRADLLTMAEVYMKTEQFGAAKEIYLRLSKRNRTRRILYRLIYLTIRTNELEEAEAFYEEFLGVSTSSRDNIILRYRLDKAKGVSIGQQIETLELLKDEEYIEEWAYELAKLYQKAGREDDCRQECQDIRLWFGQGEIVDRATALLEHLDCGGQLYYEDQDYTEKKEKPNPDDTGSLPDLSPEALKREKEWLKQKQREEKDKKEASYHSAQESTQEKEGFVDDYQEESDEDEGEMLMEPGEIAQIAKEGFMKLSGFLKRDNKSAEEVKSDKKKEENSSFQNTQEISLKVQDGFDKDSHEGTGVTQDLAKEISAIFEAEHRGQLKEKAVTVMNEVPERAAEVPNVAANVVNRMAQAMQNKTAKLYIPLEVSDSEHLEEEPAASQVQPDGMEEIVSEKIQETNVDFDVESKELPAAQNRQKDEEEVTMIELNQIMSEPDMPEMKQVMPEDSPEFGGQQELEEKDLPTTRALHNSFDDMLTLIEGEREPKHFVLMGEGEERIIGITKKIVRVMSRKNFLSTNQIARIHSNQLNEMELLRVCQQIKGSCLLIDGAAQLSFPTITKIFALMDAFHGDFMVVLADEGNTLDDLFRVAPALARRFEYVIDINQYEEKDYH